MKDISYALYYLCKTKVLTEFKRRQITAGMHPAVVGTRANVILTLILEILLQITGKSTKRRLNQSTHINLLIDPYVLKLAYTYALLCTDALFACFAYA